MNPMQLLDVISSRRSVRDFASTPVSVDQEQLLVDAFIAAPSAGNTQPWHLLRVRSESLRTQLARAAYGQNFIAQAPLVMVVCADEQRALHAYGRRGVELFMLQDTAAATQNLLLMAHALGLGACWVGAFREADIAACLRLPSHLRPVALLPVGVPSLDPEPTSRRPPADVSESR